MIKAKLALILDWPEQARQVKWSASALARRCGVSEDTLRRYFLEHFGRTTKIWLAEQRNNEAIALLRNRYSIKEAAVYLGYKQQTNFTRQFKRIFKYCPSQVTFVIPIKNMRSND